MWLRGLRTLHSLHKDAGLILDFAQWVKDLVWLWLRCRLAAAVLIQLLNQELPHGAGAAGKKKKKGKEGREEGKKERERKKLNSKERGNAERCISLFMNWKINARSFLTIHQVDPISLVKCWPFCSICHVEFWEELTRGIYSFKVVIRFYLNTCFI